MKRGGGTEGRRVNLIPPILRLFLLPHICFSLPQHFLPKLQLSFWTRILVADSWACSSADPLDSTSVPGCGPGERNSLSSYFLIVLPFSGWGFGSGAGTGGCEASDKKLTGQKETLGLVLYLGAVFRRNKDFFTVLAILAEGMGGNSSTGMARGAVGSTDLVVIFFIYSIPPRFVR